MRFTDNNVTVILTLQVSSLWFLSWRPMSQLSCLPWESAWGRDPHNPSQAWPGMWEKHAIGRQRKQFLKCLGYTVLSLHSVHRYAHTRLNTHVHTLQRLEPNMTLRMVYGVDYTWLTFLSLLQMLSMPLPFHDLNSVTESDLIMKWFNMTYNNWRL